MDKIRIIKDEIFGEESVIIETAPNQFISMPRAIYDAQAKEFTESLTNDSTGNK